MAQLAGNCSKHATDIEFLLYNVHCEFYEQIDSHGFNLVDIIQTGSMDASLSNIQLIAVKLIRYVAVF